MVEINSNVSHKLFVYKETVKIYHIRRIYIYKPDVLMFRLFASNGIFEAHSGKN